MKATISILTVNDQNMQTLCVFDVPGAKIGTDVVSRLANARDEQFGKCEINRFLHQGVIRGSFVFERPLLSQMIISGFAR